MVVVPIRVRSGRHRDSRSGRGFPKRFFMPCVMRNAVARESARPIQPVFHSQSFLLQISDFGVPRSAVGPGTQMRHTMKTMAAGAMRDTTTRSHVGIISLVWYGYDMSRLTGEKGRLNGSTYSQPPAMAAMAMMTIQSKM